MRIVIVAGPPSAGKTAIILHAAAGLQGQGLRPAGIKFDTRSSSDPERYRRLGMPAQNGLSGYLCPDHYFISNMEEAENWGRSVGADLLFIETAGLCLRCAPHVEGIPAVTVIDSLGGLDCAAKMGPMLTLADAVVLTKGDLVSQAEREILLHSIREVTPTGRVLAVNGLSGTGTLPLLAALDDLASGSMSQAKLRHDMPAAICSYCTGERRIGARFQSGNVEKVQWTEAS